MAGDSKKTPQRSWLISFADLLTLLLCFFLSVVSFSPLNPNSPQASAALSSRDDGQKSDSMDEIHRFGSRGTQLAHISKEAAPAKVEEHDIQIVLSDVDFEGRGTKLSEQGQRRIENAIFGADLSARRIRIHTCAEEVSLEGNAAYEFAGHRATELRRQLIDAASNLKRDGFLFRNLGRRCETIDNAAAMIDLDLEKRDG